MGWGRPCQFPLFCHPFPVLHSAVSILYFDNEAIEKKKKMQQHQEPTEASVAQQMPGPATVPVVVPVAPVTTTVAAVSNVGAAPGHEATRLSGATVPVQQQGQQQQQQLAQDEIQLSDEQILTQMQAIKDEEANAHPLVDNSVDLTELEKEYENNQSFKNKIKNLADTHDRMRRSRGDGNCFYRAFAFAWFERVMLAKSKPELHANAIKAIEDSKDLLLAAQFELLAFEDFYLVTLETLQNLVHFTPEDLLVAFQNDETSNSIVMHLRLVASAFLKTRQEDYAPFLEFGQTMEEFCSMHVEAMGRESEEMMLIALTKAMHISIEVAYLSGNESADEVNFLPFLPDTAPYMPPLVLLYRPGHYDILYRKSHCLEGVV